MGYKPRIRFKGFTEDWEQREFSDIFAEVKSGLSRMLSNDDIGLPVVRANNINDGQLNLFDDIKYWYKNDPQGANTNNYLIEQGDILINFINSEAKMGTAAYVTRRPERDTIYTTNILRCKVNDEYNPYFIYSLTFLNSYKNYIASITKPAVNQASFTTVDFKKYSIKIPTVKEQNQIANLIEIFNKFITLHQCKLEKLKLTKKALLQKLFPKNGKHIPEIRFKGFTDAWEQREFSDIFAEVKSGLSRMLSNDDIGLPVVRANNINDGQLNLFDDIKYWYKNDPQGANTNNYLIEQGDILINFINSEAKMGTAAYVTRRPERDTIYTTNILRCKVNDEYNPYFIYSLTFLNSYKNYIASITKPAVNQASFTTVDFKKYSIKIPTVKEQNQIANLIEIFNKFITLHQRKLERLQEVKKGLLQKMFV